MLSRYTAIRNEVLRLLRGRWARPREIERIVARGDEGQAERQRLLDWWELASGGKEAIELDMWCAELEKALLFTRLALSRAKRACDTRRRRRTPKARCISDFVVGEDAHSVPAAHIRA